MEGKSYDISRNYILRVLKFLIFSIHLRIKTLGELDLLEGAIATNSLGNPNLIELYFKGGNLLPDRINDLLDLLKEHNLSTKVRLTMEYHRKIRY